MNAIYICQSPYHILITCAKELLNNGSQNSSIVLIDPVESQYDEIEKRLREVHLFDKVYRIKRNEIFASWARSSQGILPFINFKICAKTIRRKLRYLNDYDNIYIFNDLIDIGIYLHVNGIKYHLIEDGYNCFKKFDQHDGALLTSRVPRLRKILRRYLPISFGESNYCIDIELNSLDNLATKLNKPLIEVNRREMFDSLNLKQKRRIAYILTGYEVASLKENACLILTSPATRNLWGINNDDYIVFMEKIIKEQEGRTVYLKPHPRDQFSYSALSKKCIIIEKGIPIEIYDLLADNKIDILVGFLSTALDSFKNCKHKKIYTLEDVVKIIKGETL